MPRADAGEAAEASDATARGLSANGKTSQPCAGSREGDGVEACLAELNVLGDMLGARCVDAAEVETSVINRFDTAVELQHQRAKLDRMEAAEGPSAMAREPRKEGNEVSAPSAQLREEVLRLEHLAEEQRVAARQMQMGHGPASRTPSSPSVATAAAAPAVVPQPAEAASCTPRWGKLKSGVDLKALLAELGDSDEESEEEEKEGQSEIEESGLPCRPAAAPKSSANSALGAASPGAASSTATAKGTSHKDGTAAAAQQAARKATVSAQGRISNKEYLQSFYAKKKGDRQGAACKVELSRKLFALSAERAREQAEENSPSALPTGTPQQRPTLDEKQAHASKSASAVQLDVKKEGDKTPLAAPTKYKIDVTQIIPKPAQDHNRWKEAHTSEWKALVSQGETVSPHKNLLRAQHFAPGKRKRTENDQSDVKGKKSRGRQDDTNERVYQRRQELLVKGARAPVPALAAKQQVDENGVPIKAEILIKEERQELPVPGLQDDVGVAEGLRSPRWLWEALYPYQHECVRWLWGLHCQRSGGILADEMGLGKTVQIAAFLAALHHSGILQNMRVRNTSLGSAMPESSGGILVVCPATLIDQWRNELHVWYPPLRVCVMHQLDEKARKEAIHAASSQQGVLITSYDTMRITIEELLEAPWVILILDEGQMIRNPNINTTIATKRFSTPHRIVLSGSPIQNRLQELWSIFDFICPGRLGTLPVFLEEFAQPIEAGNLVGASEARVAAAYECAMALRELTQPCILRRTKADNMDVLKLPPKQEQVLFCHLTPEQFQVYIDFLQTEQVRRAMTSVREKQNRGALFFSISVLRKLCNHPDLLLLDADPELMPPDMWNIERSGKMKVLAKIMKLWRTEGHRPLIFVQTIQMLQVIQRWMKEEGYVHLRIDGTTPVKKRLKMIEEFNGNQEIFAMLLTTRVGGVGLNIIGANRVVIFDPDWNPMTDVQARERTWRIGQTREVAVYRLVLTGSLEEKIYQRQVYKHFLSQKILNDPRQRQFFKWNDLADLFEMPTAPPDFNPEDMRALRAKYTDLFKKYDRDPGHGDDEVETTELMKAITNLPTKDQHVTSQAQATEQNTILQTLYDSNGIKATFNHDKVEQTLLDRKIVRDGANLIAKRALLALQKSSRECAQHDLSQPTWTGHQGSAGAPLLKRDRAGGAVVKQEVSGGGAGGIRAVSTASSVSSADILQGLRQLSAIRSVTQQRTATQADDAARLGITPSAGELMSSPARRSLKLEPSDESSLDGANTLQIPEVALGTNCAGLPIELLDSDREVAEVILKGFLDPKLAGPQHCLSTERVLQHLAAGIASHHADLFKTLLQQMCEFSKPGQPREPGIWILRREFWPRRGHS